MSEHFTLADIGDGTTGLADQHLWYRVTWDAGGVGWAYFPTAVIVPDDQRRRSWVLRWLNARIDRAGRDAVLTELRSRRGLVID